MADRIVIALGGNALGNTPSEQLEKIRAAAPHLVSLIAEGYEIIVTHGNGPQVGMISSAFSDGAKVNKKIPAMPLPECTAMSEGLYRLPPSAGNFVRAPKAQYALARVLDDNAGRGR